jgi:hypothetical protein
MQLVSIFFKRKEEQTMRIAMVGLYLLLFPALVWAGTFKDNFNDNNDEGWDRWLNGIHIRSEQMRRARSLARFSPQNRIRNKLAAPILGLFDMLY